MAASGWIEGNHNSNKVQSRGTNIFLCGDWNINFLQRSTKLSELQNLLLKYNLVNTVKSPTRITHDIAKNNSTVGMRHILDFVTNVTHTNVIVMSALHRHDLMSNSCVNKEIEKFNRKLRLRLGRLGRVEMIDVVNDRNLYTRHGQHLNTEGKETMAKKIASTIECVLNKQVEPITGKWYTDKAIDTLDHHPVQGMINDNTEVEINERSSTSGGFDTLKVQDAKQKVEEVTQNEDKEAQTTHEQQAGSNQDQKDDKLPSKRARKPPTTRHEDFLWLDRNMKH